jgi:signal transduction histidine kinase
MSLRVAYEQVLRRFLAEHQEIDLMRAYELGKELQGKQVQPDEVVGMHLEALMALPVDMPDEERLKEVQTSFAVLIETMIAYGIAYGDAFRLLEQTAREAEEAKFELEKTIVELDLANQQLHDVDRVKTQFFSNMSHELRTPLNAIIGFSEDAIDGLAGELTPKQNRYVANILSAARHLLTVINDILDLSKLQAGKVRLELAEVSLAEVFEEMSALMAPLVARKRIALAFSGAEGLPPVRADRAKVAQILMNLLSNAHKFTPEGGRIRVEARAEGADVAIAVADDGVGIPAADLPHLFEEFRQVEHRRAPGEAQGTGLGLAITKRLVDVHGGTIGVASEPEAGSTFTFTLPFARPPA